MQRGQQVKTVDAAKCPQHDNGWTTKGADVLQNVQMYRCPDSACGSLTVERNHTCDRNRFQLKVALRGCCIVVTGRYAVQERDKAAGRFMVTSVADSLGLPTVPDQATQTVFTATH